MSDSTTTKTHQEHVTWTFAKRADSLNADGLFVISKLKDAKTLSKLEELNMEYNSTRSLIATLLIDISNSSKSHHLTLRSMSKRLRYVDDYLRREFESRRSRFIKAQEAEILRVNTTGRSSKLNAKLLAKFIIDEAVKLNDLQRNKPSQETDLGRDVSKVSPSTQISAATLSAALNNDEQSIEEIDFLGGMDDVL